MKTLKQIAEEIGVSKDKIKYRARKLPSNYLVKIGEITHVTDEGIEEIREYFDGEKAGNEGKNQVNTQEREIIEILKTELAARNREIEVLTKMLAAEQALHAATVARITDQNEIPSRTGFFTRLFRRKKTE